MFIQNKRKELLLKVPSQHLNMTDKGLTQIARVRIYENGFVDYFQVANYCDDDHCDVFRRYAFLTISR